MNETEVAVCPRCARPYPPGQDYCTHCGGQLGIAETTLPYIPVPNSARFSDEVEPPPPSRPRPVYRAALIGLLALVPVTWSAAVVDSIDAWVAGVITCGLVGAAAWLYFTLSTR
ncbi:MAG: hypothetical protein ACYTHK_18870 [Planctomycetota bacterium]